MFEADEGLLRNMVRTCVIAVQHKLSLLFPFDYSL